MANKLCTVLDNLQTALEALVTAETLADFKREVIVPAKEHTTPVLGMVAARLRRETSAWLCDVSLPLLTRAGGDDTDENIITLIGTVTDTIETLIKSGGAGGRINQPVWDFWYNIVGEGLRKVGAIGGLTITVEDPLTTP